MHDLLIYGANGYTGELIAREAELRGLRPILAGRSASKLEALAAELGVSFRAFDLANTATVAQHLRGVKVVLNCAGPFSATSVPMIEGCLQVGAHYLDITGEIGVFEHVHSLHDQAVRAGVVLCSGVGFDVIPSDCVAARLKEALPDATHLALGFDTRSSFSPGTIKTTVEGLGQGGKVRRDGRIVRTPLAHSVRKIDFGDGEKLAMTIPWGDVSTAYHSTGIPNVEFYIPSPPTMIIGAKCANHLRWLLGREVVQKTLKKKAGETRGPSDVVRAMMPAYVWGEARNAAREIKTARVKTANVYSLTATGALAVAKFVLECPVDGGSYTPSKLCGSDLVENLPGSSSITIC
ncbi:hypothetical protein E4T66_17085 [Sinimarinibacterium sp. CAU 1509]|uniref:saccharopine dehydrogenase family protein n=1 Tax=Sinimarinibacterium sp. CAU 1509 TaxID=2562283 RepID=UPI0010AB9928|nr:hypothetical protein E4T66_17085 [Sinimarinibacterium sp. CAU 1509]